MPEGTNEAGAKNGEGQEGANNAPPPKQEPKAGAAGAGEGSKKPEGEKPKGEPTKKPEEGAAAKGGEGGKSKEPKQIGEDDEIPEDSELVSMSKQALGKRLDRHTKKELRERFGTDDYAQIKKDLDELKTLREEKETKRRAELSENEKLKEDLAKEKKAREEAEARAQKTVDAQTFAEYDQTAKEVFGDKVAPKHMKRAMRELKEHILGLEDNEAPSDVKKAKKVFEKWAKDWLEENPEFAKPAPDEPKKIKLSTGADPNAKREKGDPQMAHKTAKPGQVNSMSKAEYAQYKRERGLS